MTPFASLTSVFPGNGPQRVQDEYLTPLSVATELTWQQLVLLTPGGRQVRKI